MIDAAPFILSLAMLAALALALGGGLLIAKRRDRKRGMLMLMMALVLLGNILLWAVPMRAIP